MIINHPQHCIHIFNLQKYSNTNCQVFSILGGTFREHSASAFAIMKFMQCLAASIAFWYSPVLGLYWQLLIAVIFDVLGTIAFCTVEWRRGRYPTFYLQILDGLKIIKIKLYRHSFKNIKTRCKFKFDILIKLKYFYVQKDRRIDLHDYKVAALLVSSVRLKSQQRV